MLCVTGLPLVFHDEIDAAMAGDTEATLGGPPSADSGLPLDVMLDKALAGSPGSVPLFMAFSQDSPLLTVTTGPGPDAAPDQMDLFFFDRTTGASLGPAESLYTKYPRYRFNRSEMKRTVATTDDTNRLNLV